MKILHILRSEPTEDVKRMINSVSSGHETMKVEISKENVDYDRLIQLIFDHDKVISWW